MAPWWAECSKEAFSTGLDQLARALKNWGDSRNGKWRLQPDSKPTGKQEPHEDRDPQFRSISAVASMFVSSGLPVVSIGAKKKELAGNFASGGREWARAGEAPAVSDHGFPSWAEGKAIPYGVCDLAGNEGFASAGAARSRACKKHLAAFAGRRSLEEVTGKEMRQLERTRITRHDWHPEWNCTVHGADKPED